MHTRISPAEFMPQAAAVVAAGMVASYLLAGLITEAMLGCPSSTAGIGYLFVPIYSALAALAGLAVGHALKGMLRHRVKEVASVRFALGVAGVTIVVGGLAAWSAANNVVAFEQANIPRVLSNAGRFVRTELARDRVPEQIRQATTVWSHEHLTQASIRWNEQDTTVRVNDGRYLTITVGQSRNKVVYDFHGRTYLTRIEGLPVQSASGNQEHLAVLVRLRATSFRSMLLLFDSTGHLVYEELLKRCGSKEAQFMGASGNGLMQALIVDQCIPIQLVGRKAG